MVSHINTYLSQLPIYFADSCRHQNVRKRFGHIFDVWIQSAQRQYLVIVIRRRRVSCSNSLFGHDNGFKVIDDLVESEFVVADWTASLYYITKSHIRLNFAASLWHKTCRIASSSSSIRYGAASEAKTSEGQAAAVSRTTSLKFGASAFNHTSASEYSDCRRYINVFYSLFFTYLLPYLLTPFTSIAISTFWIIIF